MSDGRDVHLGIDCDGCSKNAFKLRRYKCLICADFDLCGDCFDTKKQTQNHLSNHPMICILTDSDKNLIFEHDKSLSEGMLSVYPCPLCCKKGFDIKELVSHVASCKDIALFGSHVLCPICAAVSSSNVKHNPLSAHFAVTHKPDTGGRVSLQNFIGVRGRGRARRNRRYVANNNNATNIPVSAIFGSSQGNNVIGDMLNLDPDNPLPVESIFGSYFGVNGVAANTGRSAMNDTSETLSQSRPSSRGIGVDQEERPRRTHYTTVVVDEMENIQDQLERLEDLADSGTRDINAISNNVIRSIMNNVDLYSVDDPTFNSLRRLIQSSLQFRQLESVSVFGVNQDGSPAGNQSTGAPLNGRKKGYAGVLEESKEKKAMDYLSSILKDPIQLPELPKRSNPSESSTTCFFKSALENVLCNRKQQEESALKSEKPSSTMEKEDQSRRNLCHLLLKHYLRTKVPKS